MGTSFDVRSGWKNPSFSAIEVRVSHQSISWRGRVFFSCLVAWATDVLCLLFSSLLFFSLFPPPLLFLSVFFFPDRLVVFYCLAGFILGYFIFFSLLSISYIFCTGGLWLGVKNRHTHKTLGKIVLRRCWEPCLVSSFIECSQCFMVIEVTVSPRQFPLRFKIYVGGKFWTLWRAPKLNLNCFETTGCIQRYRPLLIND